jgi:tRNA/tmRNA/rRNA uracil-C5-methylase (TrmA/RlmC/RlmD family)
MEGQCDDTDVLVADPPRKGLSTTVLNFLSNRLPDKPLPESLRRFIYVSCGYDSLERDTR